MGSVTLTCEAMAPLRELTKLQVIACEAVADEAVNEFIQMLHDFHIQDVSFHSSRWCEFPLVPIDLARLPPSLESLCTATSSHKHINCADVSQVNLPQLTALTFAIDPHRILPLSVVPSLQRLRIRIEEDLSSDLWSEIGTQLEHLSNLVVRMLLSSSASLLFSSFALPSRSLSLLFMLFASQKKTINLL